jgi:hypothetical protein
VRWRVNQGAKGFSEGWKLAKAFLLPLSRSLRQMGAGNIHNSNGGHEMIPDEKEIEINEIAILKLMQMWAKDLDVEKIARNPQEKAALKEARRRVVARLNDQIQFKAQAVNKR